MARIPVSNPYPPVQCPSDKFLAACERLLAERGVDGNVCCLGLEGLGRQFDDGGLRIAALTTGHDAGALDVQLTFAGHSGTTITAPAVERLPGFRLTRVHTHWVYGAKRIEQYERQVSTCGPIYDTPYACPV